MRCVHTVFKENIATKLFIHNGYHNKREAGTYLKYFLVFPEYLVRRSRPSFLLQTFNPAAPFGVSTIISNSCCSLCERALSLSWFCFSLNLASCLSFFPLTIFSLSFSLFSFFSLISVSCLSLSFLSRSISSCSFSLLSSSFFCLSLSSFSSSLFLFLG